MILEKKDCPISMRIVPYGAGWTDVYFNFDQTEELYFVVSSAIGDNLTDFLRAVYELYPNRNDVLYFNYGDDSC